jgi:uncharacterized RDD family membrane protein YckC
MASYYIRRGSKTKGPFSAQQTAELFRAKELKESDEVSTSETGPWRRVGLACRKFLAEADNTDRRRRKDSGATAASHMISSGHVYDGDTLGRSGVRYFVRKGSETNGPFAAQQIAELFRAKELKANDEIAESQTGPWSRMASVYRRILAEADHEDTQSDEVVFAEAPVDEYDDIPEVLVLDEPAVEESPASDSTLGPDNGRLASCEDCGGSVSRRASTCPHCGAPAGTNIVTTDGLSLENANASQYGVAAYSADDTYGNYEDWTSVTTYDPAEGEYQPAITRRKRRRSRSRKTRPREYLASRRRRVVAYVIDGVLQTIVGLFGGAVFYVTCIEHMLDGALLTDDAALGLTVILVAVALAAQFILVIPIQAILLVGFGQTIGKMVCGIQVVDADDGSGVSFGRVVILRYVIPWVISRFFPVFDFIDAMFIFDDDKQCLHDRFANTVVVYA